MTDAPHGFDSVARSAISNGSVKRNVLPRPGLALEQSRPPIRSTRRDEMLKPEAGAAELARRRSVRLFEGLEHVGLLRLRNADAGVGDGERAARHAWLRSRVVRQRDPDGDFAGRGEFHRVANQVHQRSGASRCESPTSWSGTSGATSQTSSSPFS